MGELNDHGMSSGGTSGLSDGLRRLIDQHRSDSERAQEALRQMPGSDGRCELYEERGSVEFFEGNRVRLRARAQMIGTYSPAESTWEWSWANPDLSPNLIAATLSLRESTESAMVPEFREPSFTCSENEAWAVAGVARGLLHAHSVYRAPQEDVWNFLALYEPQEMDVQAQPVASPSNGQSDRAERAPVLFPTEEPRTEKAAPGRPRRKSSKRPPAKAKAGARPSRGRSAKSSKAKAAAKPRKRPTAKKKTPAPTKKKPRKRR